MRAAPAIIRLDAASIAAGVGAGRLDPVAVAEAFLAEARRRDPELGALVNHDEAAPLAEARSLRDRIASGESLPLAGVPCVVKDSIWVAGRRITQGSRLFEDHVAPRDALPVVRLRAAGAIVLGIGNMSELGAKDVTDNVLHGETRNPRDPGRTPGGSSGGCASALGADMAPVALGGDGGGSCRRPPAHVGVVGFKPTPGAVADPWGFPSTLPGIGSTCPMGRTVVDTALLFDAIVGAHPLDPLSVPLPTGPEPAPPRVAWSPRLGLGLAVDEDVAACVERAVERLREAGLAVTEADPPWPPETSEAQILAIEESHLASQFGPRWRESPDLFDPHIGWQIERGLRRSAAEVAAAHEASLGMAAVMARFFESWDLLLCPTVACVAWPLGKRHPDQVEGRPSPGREHAAFTPLFNHARTPALTLPCGAGRGGLPVGLQVVGPRFADRRVLRAGRRIEAALGASARPWMPVR